MSVGRYNTLPHSTSTLGSRVQHKNRTPFPHSPLALFHTGTLRGALRRRSSRSSREEGRESLKL